MIHELKCVPPHFHNIVEGTKTFELRKNDRDFRINDYLNLKEYIPATGEYTGAERLVRVIGILQNYQGLAAGFCILSIEVIRSEYEIKIIKKIESERLKVCPHKDKKCYLWKRMQKPENIGIALCNYERLGICVRDRKYYKSELHYKLGIVSPNLLNDSSEDVKDEDTN